ncbi:MAG TPA: PAS domain S-box protein [Polyangiaceae bacterium]|nr:PAS domain S-box protein [Polyangiaceae bacterium]
MGPSTNSTRSDAPRDADLSRAESFGLRDLRMVMDDLEQRGLPAAADDFPWPLLMHDGERILHANPASFRWLGCTGDGALVQQPLAVLCREEDERALLAAVGAGSKGPPATAHLQRFADQQGHTLLGHVLARRQPLDGSHVTFVLVAPFADSDRSFELLQLLGEAVDHLTDIVFITEAHAIDGVGRRVVFVNRAFTQSSGYEAREVLGKTPSITIGEGTDRKVLARLEAALSQTHPVREDLLKYGKDGAPYWVELQIIPIFDESGEHTHWISIQRDISERKRMEARLLESARLASAGQLSASLAVELNTPLASVVSTLEWLADRLPLLLGQTGQSDQPELKETLEALADARQSAARMAAVTGYLQLLGVSAPPLRHALRIDSLLDSAVAEAESQLGRKLHLQRDETDLLVLADPARMGHALRLVVLNAGLSSTDGQIRIEATTVGQRVHVYVDDSGSGIAPDMAGTLGAPFEVRKPPGIGDSLALFVASRLIAELDGELVLTLRPNGTRVELRLARAP